MADEPWEGTMMTTEESTPPIFRKEDMPALHVADFFEKMAKEHGDNIAFSVVLPRGSEGSVTYTEVLEQARALAAYLRGDLGLVDGDVVALMSPNSLTYPVIVNAVFIAGLTLTNINPLYTSDEVHHQLNDSGAKALFVLDMFGGIMAQSIKGTAVQHVIKVTMGDLFSTFTRLKVNATLKYILRVVPKFNVPCVDSYMSALEKGRKGVLNGADVTAYRATNDENSIAIYQYTGGTTGRSKGAMLTHMNLMANLHQLALAEPTHFGKGSLVGKSVLLMLPLYHVYALIFGVLVTPWTGCHVVLIPSPRPMSNVRIAMERYPPHVLPAINTLFQMLLEEEWFCENPPETLEICVSGATALSAVVAEEFQELTGAPILEAYGMTESTAGVSIASPADRSRGGVGKPIPGTEVKLMTPEGENAEQGERGEIWIRGPQIMAGYLNNTDATSEAIVDGWYKSGDVGKFDGEGNLYIVDRMKDMIIVSGFNVFPTDVEEVIARHDGVLESTVVGILDKKSGERPVACVVRKDNSLTKEAVIDHCRQSLTGYKVPKDVIFVSSLPKSPVGKVLRRVLRDQVRSGEIVSI